MTRLRVWWSGGIFAAITAAYPFLIQSWRAWAQAMEKSVTRFQIIAGRWLAFIILPAAFWGGVALLFF